MKYLDERAMDTGGVARDMLSMFWESVYVKMLDGSTLLIHKRAINTRYLPAINLQKRVEFNPQL